MRRHPGKLGDPAQLHLTPAAAGLRPAQGRDKRLGLSAKLVGARGGQLHLLRQRRVRRLSRQLGLPELGLNSGQGLRERGNQVLDRVLPRVKFVRGVRLRCA